MASLVIRKSGTRFIQFEDANGDRKTIGLDRMPKCDATIVLGRVRSLLAATIARTPWDRETAEWVGKVGSIFYDKLAKVGLVPKRAEAELTERETVGAFIDAYMAKRTDAKPSTITNLNCVRRELVEFLTANKALADITEADAKDFRRLLTQRLAENTVRRHCSRARQFFAAAVESRFITANPFSCLKRLTVQANESRFYFATLKMASAAIDACPNAEWRVIVALAR